MIPCHVAAGVTSTLQLTPLRLGLLYVDHKPPVGHAIVGLASDYLRVVLLTTKTQ